MQQRQHSAAAWVAIADNLHAHTEVPALYSNKAPNRPCTTQPTFSAAPHKAAKTSSTWPRAPEVKCMEKPGRLHAMQMPHRHCMAGRFSLL